MRDVAAAIAICDAAVRVLLLSATLDGSVQAMFAIWDAASEVLARATCYLESCVARCCLLSETLRCDALLLWGEGWVGGWRIQVCHRCITCNIDVARLRNLTLYIVSAYPFLFILIIMSALLLN